MATPVSFSDTSQSFLARRASVVASLGGVGSWLSLEK